MAHKDFDADGHAAFLKEKAKEDLEVAEEMLARKSNGFVLFLAHAAVQKTLAIIICKETQKMPPWRGDVTKLAGLANVKLTKEQRELCKVLNFYHKEGLYLGLQYPEPSKKEARELLSRAKELVSSLPDPLAE